MDVRFMCSPVTAPAPPTYGNKQLHRHSRPARATPRPSFVNAVYYSATASQSPSRYAPTTLEAEVISHIFFTSTR